MTGAHCETCRCHERQISPPVRAGQWVRNRLTAEIGVVRSVHISGIPYVEGNNGERYGWWYHYDILDGMEF